MTDARVQKQAEVLIRYCLALKPGQELRIEGPSLAEPLIQEVFRAALKAGVYPSTNIVCSGLNYIRFRDATDAQLQHISEFERLTVEKMDAILTIWADWNTKELTGIDARRLALYRSARKELFNRYLERIARGELRWCGTLFPTHAGAQDAEMALEEYEDFAFTAMHLNKPDPVAEWQRISAEQARLVLQLNSFQTLSLHGPDTELNFSCAGRKWVNCDGRQNFPDGELFTCPIENSVQGRIRFSFPAVHSGKEVEDVQLWFDQGRVVEARARKGEDFLKAMLDTDEGARRVGELAFGVNYGIQRFTRNTLFDEKIGGTIHLALGASLAEAGGVNQSAIHWDMVCDFRAGGEVYADGRLIYRDGKFLI